MNNDLISRSALKSEFDKHCVGQCNECHYCGEGGDCTLIDNAPTVELQIGGMVNGVIIPITRPQGEWIPVSERLPEMGESVLVCIKTQGGISQYVSERFHDNQWSALGGRTPIAWRPLPEPYKKGGAE